MLTEKSQTKSCKVTKNRVNGLYCCHFIFIGLLIGAILANIAQYPDIENRINKVSVNYPTFKAYESFDMVEIGRKYSGSFTRDRFGSYLALSQIAPGANLLLPIECPLIDEKLYGLGRVGKIERFHYDPELMLLEFDPTNYDLISIEGSERRGPGPVAIVLRQTAKQMTLIAFKRDKTWYLVETDLVPTHILEVILK